MTTTAWAHLPNATHIDRVLAARQAHPDEWTPAWQVAWYEAWDAAWDAAKYTIREKARVRAGGKEYGPLWDAPIRSASGGAVMALIAWDDCAYMLDLPEDTLSELRAVGNQPALLLSVAASVLNLLKETS